MFYLYTVYNDQQLLDLPIRFSNRLDVFLTNRLCTSLYLLFLTQLPSMSDTNIRVRNVRQSKKILSG